MTIAKKATGLIGQRAWAPEGPFGTAGNFPMPSFAPGEVAEGELGAEYEYVLLPVTAAITLNQGDCIVYDNSGYGVQSLTGAGAHPFGASVGFVFYGGRVAEETIPVAGNIWSYTYQPGIYGIWVQRAGKGLVNCLTINAQTKPLNTTAVAGQLNAPTTPLAGSMGMSPVFTCPLTWTFTGTVTSGSSVITAVAWTKTPGITKGQTITGTGIPAGSYVVDFVGSTVTFSNLTGTNATATNTGVTVTVANNLTTLTTTNLSPVLTNVTSIAGLYPNQTLTGTGIVGTIVSITGNSAPYTITMSGNSTATANNITAVPSVYVEAFIYWPAISSQN